MPVVHDRSVHLDGLHHGAGAPGAPTIVLLHGYPPGSRLFRDLIRRIAHRFRVLAPIHIGFEFSSAPPVDEYSHTFDARGCDARVALASADHEILDLCPGLWRDDVTEAIRAWADRHDR